MYYQLQSIPLEGIKTKEEFVETGRIVPISVFKDNFSNENLHVDARNVIVYAGSHYIQILSTAEFFTDGITDKDVDKVEDYLWKKIK
jgi:hypothetical protein